MSKEAIKAEAVGWLVGRDQKGISKILFKGLEPRISAIAIIKNVSP